jgi:hypothetical protein
MPKIEINITGNGPMMGQQIAGLGCCPHCLDREPQSASSMGVSRSHPALAGSAVDAMLKKRGYETGSLYARIDKALADNLLTKRMADWAHEVRLGSNRPRRADKTNHMYRRPKPLNRWNLPKLWEIFHSC